MSALGHREVYLLVQSDNLAAVSLYLSFGFEAVLEDAAEAAQWRLLDDAARGARGARAAARASRGADAAYTVADETAPPQPPAAGEAASGRLRWAAAVCARASALADSPDGFLTEVVCTVRCMAQRTRASPRKGSHRALIFTEC